MDFIVALYGVETFGQEGDWVPLVIFLGVLRQNCSCSEVRAVGFNSELVGVGWQYQDWGQCDSASEFFKCPLLFFFPSPGGIAGDVIERSSDVREVLDESAVKVYKANKLLYFLLRLQSQPLGHSDNFDWVHHLK
jgi:hypothetical protein